MGNLGRNIRIVFGYDGTEFAGSQLQKNNRTVQSELEDALGKIMKHSARLKMAGRTDAGVHARGQVGAFETTCKIPVARVPAALNSELPGDILVSRAKCVDMKFNPRRDAKKRSYRFNIDNREVPDVLLSRFAWHIRDVLDIGRMEEAAKTLVGVHDYRSFHASGSDLGSTVREIMSARCRRARGLVTVTLEANAFLYRMVRIVVGTLVEIGCGKREPRDMRSILEAQNRKVAGKTAPAHGLCLVKVSY